ncbi:MAG: DUF1801 domain-containing protein [Phycisphaerales bacterium]|nr:DUF1801 domain-containing protein [Phycisphaerales bacterium]
MISKAGTVAEYLKELPEDRRTAIQAVREVVLANLDQGFAEIMQYGMIGYCVPHSIYPPGYHCSPEQPLPFAGLASQKNHMALYLMCIYGSGAEETWFRQEWAKTGKKLDMGKSCIRFKRLEDLPLELIGRTIARVKLQEYVDWYEKVIRSRERPKSATKTGSGSRGSSAAKTDQKKTRKAAAKRTTKKKSAATKRGAAKGAKKRR